MPVGILFSDTAHAMGERCMSWDRWIRIAVGIRLHDEGAVSCVAHVDKHPDGGFKMRRARVRHKPSKLRRGISNVDARHVGKPQ